MAKNVIASFVVCSALILAACGSGGSPSPGASPTPSSTAGPKIVPAPAEPAPDRDLYDLAVRFGKADPNTPRTLPPGPARQLGERRAFWLMDPPAVTAGRIEADLQEVSAGAYFYVQHGVSVTAGNLARAARQFDEVVYPAVTGVFGQERSPGMDGDPRIVILIAPLNGAGGYVSGGDAYPAVVSPYSNEAEILYIDASIPPGSLAFDAVVAHELQHLIHANADENEDAWVNEGLSQIAFELLGAGTGSIAPFLQSPDVQLNDWVGLDDDPSPHYAASELFFRYLLGRFGGLEGARDLLAQPEDGSDGIDQYLLRFSTDFRSVFADWIVANYLDAPDGVYEHQGANLRTRAVTPIDSFGDGEAEVRQFGADYLLVEPPTAGFEFEFKGAASVPLVAAGDGSDPFWWSGRGDGMDARLTREIDLRGLSAATLNFRLWYEIEEGWDYAYVAVSADGGISWQAMAGQHTTEESPLGQAYGPGYTGNSGGGGQARWVDERVDLSAYIGEQVLLRFEYVTDDATNFSGFAIDDIAIAGAGGRDGATDAGSWRAEGFLRVDAPARQEFILIAISVVEDNDPARVHRIGLNEANTARVEVTGPTVFVVAGAMLLTRELASYSWSFARRGV